MTLTLTAVAEPSHVPPRVRLEAEEDDPTRSLSSCAFFRDGVALRFSATITDQLALAYDYDAQFDVAMAYRADVVESVLAAPSTEGWANLAAWLSPPAVAAAGWAVAPGTVSSTSPGAIIYLDAGGTIAKVEVTSPSNMTLQLTDAANTVLGSVAVKPDGKIVATGTTASSVVGSGSYTVTVSGSSMAVVGTGWSTSVPFTGTPTRVRLVAPPEISFVKQWGGPDSGSGNGEFSFASAIARDASGSVYVVDQGNNRIQKFNSSGVYQSQFGTSGSGNGQFASPAGIAIDGSGNIWVVDKDNSRIQKFNSSGVYQSQFGTFGTGNGQFNQPTALAIDGSGNIWVADTANNRIQKFNSSGVYQSQFGTVGSGNGQFWFPSGIVVDGSGNLYVLDTNNNRVQKFNSSHTYQSQYGTYGTGNGQFYNPQGIAIDGSGNIWVADTNNERLQKFNSSGVYQSQFGTYGSAEGQFANVYGLCFDGTLIYVVDSGNVRIQKFTTAAGSTDDITTTLAGSEASASASDTETLAGVGVWLTNSVNPDLALQLDDCDDPAIEFALGEETRKTTRHASTAVALKIEGSSKTLSVSTGPREEAEWTLEVICKTEVARKALESVLADNAPISLRIAADHAYLGLDGGFYSVGDYSSDRPRGPLVDEETSVPLLLTPTFAPAYDSLWQWNWDALAQTGLTWDEVAVMFPTWNDLLIGPVA